MAIRIDEGYTNMRTHPVPTKSGDKSFAFEIENAYIAPSTVARLLAGVAGVTDVRPRKKSSKSIDVHVEFMFQGQPYIVLEPFGDSSRYWIGPKDKPNSVGEIAELEDAFKSYRPPAYRVLFGDLVTLRFMTRLLSRIH